MLVPSHRSYFDFIILQLLFYDRHLLPPHIAARENMGFGPFGVLFNYTAQLLCLVVIRRFMGAQSQQDPFIGQNIGFLRRLASQCLGILKRLIR